MLPLPPSDQKGGRPLFLSLLAKRGGKIETSSLPLLAKRGGEFETPSSHVLGKRRGGFRKPPSLPFWPKGKGNSNPPPPFPLLLLFTFPSPSFPPWAMGLPCALPGPSWVLPGLFRASLSPSLGPSQGFPGPSLGPPWASLG